MLISRDEPAEETRTRERCWIRELLNDPRVPEVSLAECRVAPGETTERHRLTVAEWYVIRAGRGTMHVGDAEPFPVGPGDVVAIPPRTAQQIANTGDEDLKFACVCLPRFTAGCYEALD